MESSSNRGDGPAHAQGHLAKVIILGVPTAFASVNLECRAWNPSAFLVLGRWCHNLPPDSDTEVRCRPPRTDRFGVGSH